MNKKNIITIGLVLFIAFILLKSSLYIVTETDQVIITQFGAPVGEAIDEPGVKMKLPFVQKANRFEQRFLAWDGDPNQLPTKDKRYIKVDTYARWRISDPLLFFQRVRDERGAQSKLDDIIDGLTRDTVANHELVELVRSTERTFTYDEESEQGSNIVAIDLQKGRTQLAQQILSNANLRTQELGIELLDVRFKRINYIEEVQQKIFERMITERKRIADKFRSEGQGEASKILGDKERELKVITSEAERTAKELIGEADAEATKIYAQAYNRNQSTRDFYKFLKTMETYEKTFSEKDWLVLSTDSDLYEYLNQAR